MADLNVRSDSVNVEQIMKQIRTRIREKRGADYTQAELQQLASAKLEQFADPSGLRSDLLEQFRKRGDEPSTYHRHRGMRRLMLMMAHPILKRVQKQVMSDLNLYFEIIHNLVVETTRLGIEVQNLKMRVESLSSRLDFDERRTKAFEGVVQYRPRPAAPPPNQAAAPAAAPSSAPTTGPGPAPAPGVPGQPGQPGQQGAPRPDGEGRRRRRRRRRRRPGQNLADSPNAASAQGNNPQGQNGGAQPPAHDDGPDDDGPDDDGGDEGAADQ